MLRTNGSYSVMYALSSSGGIGPGLHACEASRVKLRDRCDLRCVLPSYGLRAVDADGTQGRAQVPSADDAEVGMRGRSVVMAVGLVAAALLGGCGDDDAVPVDGGARDGGGGLGDGGTPGDGGGTVADGGLDAGVPVDPGLVQLADFEYAGAFRVPADMFGISELNYSEGPIEYNAARNTIYLVGHTYQQAIAEFLVPGLLTTTVLTDLNMAAAPRQVFASVLDRTGGGNPQALDRIASLKLVDSPSGPELLVNAYEYYDAPADNSHTTLVVRDPDDLAGSRVDGYFSLGGGAHASGWISPIPAAYQTALGGTWITGSSSGMPIIGRLSVGPSAFVFDPLLIVGTTTAPGPVPTSALLDYDLAAPLHDDLSNDMGDNDLWTHLSRAVYGFIVPGTRSYVTLGHSGGHGPAGVCYKCVPMGETAECGGYCSRDPNDYSLYYWLFDVDDLVAVHAGTMMPSAVRPYAHGAFPAAFPTNELGGGAYDVASGLLYLTLQRADDQQGTYANPPVVVAYRIRTGT